jgi:hypothetical protein
MAKKIAPEGDFLFDDNLRARHGFASKFAFFNFGKGNDAIDSRMNRKVAANVGARACKLGAAGLTHENLASLNSLAAKTLNAEALTSVVVDVF